MTHPDASFYPRLTFDQALEQKLNVMDATALVLCRDHNLQLRVMNVFNPGAIQRLVFGEEIGSLIATGI
jgi:uridylate kinase